MARRGFPEAAATIQELWLAGRKDEAIAAVPDEYLEQTALIGDEQRIRRQLGVVDTAARGHRPDRATHRAPSRAPA